MDQAEQALLESLSVLRAARQKQGALQEDAARWRQLYVQEAEARRAAEQAKHAVEHSKQSLVSELATLKASLQSLMTKSAGSKVHHSNLRPCSSLARARCSKFGTGADEDSVRGGLLPLLSRSSATEPMQLTRPLLSSLAAAAAGVPSPTGIDHEGEAAEGTAGTAASQYPGLRRARTMSIGGLISMLVTANLLQTDSVSPRMLSRAGQEASNDAAFWATHPNPVLLHTGNGDIGATHGGASHVNQQQQDEHDASAPCSAPGREAGSCTVHLHSVDGSSAVSATAAALPALGPGCAAVLDRAAAARGSESGTSSTARRTPTEPYLDAAPPVLGNPYASLSSVSLVDDDGTSGVGLAAAAAVAAAAARAWAAAASEQQRHHHSKRMSASAGVLAAIPPGSVAGLPAAGDETAGAAGAAGMHRAPSQGSTHNGRKSGRAGYKLVASVYREPTPLSAKQLPAQMRMHAASTANIQSLAGQADAGLHGKFDASDNALPALAGAPSDPGVRMTERVHSTGSSTSGGMHPPPKRTSTSSSADSNQLVDRSNSLTISSGSSPVHRRRDAAGSPADLNWQYQQGMNGTSVHEEGDEELELGADEQQQQHAADSNGALSSRRAPARGKSNLGRAANNAAAAEPAGAAQERATMQQPQALTTSRPVDAAASTAGRPAPTTKAQEGSPSMQTGPAMGQQEHMEGKSRPLRKPSRRSLTLDVPDGSSGRGDFTGHSNTAGTLLVTSSGRMLPQATPGRAVPATPFPPHTPHMLPAQDSVLGLQGAFTVLEPTTMPGCHISSSGMSSAVGHSVPCVVEDAARRTSTHISMPPAGHSTSLPVARRTASLDMSAAAAAAGQQHPSSFSGTSAQLSGKRHSAGTTTAMTGTLGRKPGDDVEIQSGVLLPPRPSWLNTSPRTHSPFALPQARAPPSLEQQECQPHRLSAIMSQDELDAEQRGSGALDAAKVEQQNGSSVKTARTGSQRYDETHSITRRGSTAEPSSAPRGDSQDLEEQCNVCTSSGALGKSTALTLHWLSPPRTALVVCKLSDAVYPLFNKVLRWLRSQQLSVYVEPAGYAHLEPDLLPPPHAGYELPGVSTGNGPTSHVLASLSSDSDAAWSGVLTWPDGRCPQNSIPDEVAQDLDFVVVLGGDGTLLWTCHVFGNRAVPPLVPFNMGSLGFLTPFPPDHIESMLAQTLKGGFPMILRHRLHATIVRVPQDGKAAAGDVCWADGHCASEKVVLNEVVVDRGISPFLTNLECYCDGNFITHVQGDGLIISTPTGSTAYSLAAGGSMVHPQVPGILFTPVCPHSLSFRPLVFPDHVQLCIQVPLGARSQMYCSFDGKDRQELNAGDAIIIRMSQWPIPTVCSFDPSRDWFTGIREGLHWNERRVQAGAGH